MAVLLGGAAGVFLMYWGLQMVAWCICYAQSSNSDYTYLVSLDFLNSNANLITCMFCNKAKPGLGVLFMCIVRVVVCVRVCGCVCVQ